MSEFESCQDSTSDLAESRMAELLADAPLGRPYRFLESTRSTNEDALAWMKQNAPHGALITVNAQTAGRGRLGRSWEGGAGKSLLCSWVLRPNLHRDQLGLLGGAVAVAATGAIRELTGITPATKWPNDVWIGQRKVAGILLEAVWNGEQLDGVVAGIGINVNQRAEELPAHARTPPTSLAAESGHEWDRGRLLRRLAEELARTLRLLILDPHSLLEEWESLEITLGKDLEITGEGRTLRGKAVGLLPDGGLRILADGIERRLNWGEVTVRW